MERICVCTSDSRAYYSVLSRLRNTNLKFLSVNPPEAGKWGCSLVITTRAELTGFTVRTVAIEDLDNDPLIMKGQILARISGEHARGLLIGIDPGFRIGLVVYYGDAKLAGMTINFLVEDLVDLIGKIAKAIPSSEIVVKIGDGSPRMFKTIADMIGDELPRARIEIVDEKGTSVARPEGGGLKRDQKAAERIAFRKGVLYERR